MITPPFNISARPTLTLKLFFSSTFVLPRSSSSHHRYGMDSPARGNRPQDLSQHRDSPLDVPLFDPGNRDSQVRRITPRRIEIGARSDAHAARGGRFGDTTARDPHGQA